MQRQITYNENEGMSLGTRVSKLETGLESMQGDISALRADVNFIKGHLTSFATKEQVANLRGELKEDISNLRGELKEDISNLRGEFKEDISHLRGELKKLYIISTSVLGVLIILAHPSSSSFLMNLFK